MPGRKMIDWTISVGNLIQFITLLIAAISVYIGISYRIKNVEKELEKLANVVITLAIQKTEIEHLRQRIEDLSRGNGRGVNALRATASAN
jgi:cell division protein FtsL